MTYPCPKCGTPMHKGAKSQSGRQRWVCERKDGQNLRVYCYSTTDPSRPPRTQGGRKVAEKYVPSIYKRPLASRRFIITAAQNATPVHKGFLASLRKACERMDAELIVIPLRYKNPTSRWTDSQANAETWAPELVPFLWNVRKSLNRNLVLLADIKTQPTAVSPLTGFEAITHGESGILAHTKLQLKVVPTPQHAHPKILTTTGACTVPNYTDSKAGRLGAFHHTLGAALVEIAGSRFFIRQINADKDGSFYDLDVLYTPEGYTTGHAIAGLVMGDSHVDFIDPGVEHATWGPGGMVQILRPKFMVWHDLCDAYSITGHHQGNPFTAIAKQRSGRNDAAAEILRACEYVRKRTAPGQTSVLVPSNHNQFFTRYIMGTDWRQDPANAEFYLQTALDMVRETRLGERGTEFPDAFSMWARRLLNEPQFKILRRDESLMIAGVECGMHGHDGPNGSRGTLRGYRRIGVRSIVGHSHVPGIDEGCVQVGTSTRLSAEYTHGPSSWLNAHAAIYPNGKRSLLTIIDGEWRLT